MKTPTLEPRPDSTGLDRREFFASAVKGLTLAFVMPEVSRLSELEAAGSGGTVNAWLPSARVVRTSTVGRLFGASVNGNCALICPSLE